jgi:hypothetical protein
MKANFSIGRNGTVGIEVIIVTASLLLAGPLGKFVVGGFQSPSTTFPGRGRAVRLPASLMETPRSHPWIKWQSLHHPTQYRSIDDSSSLVILLLSSDDGENSNNNNDDEDNPEPLQTSLWMTPIVEKPSRAVWFSLIMSLCGAALGPFLDSYHSAFGVLQYDEPVKAQLWGLSSSQPALITTWWVPLLFGLAGFIIGWLYILLDALLLLNKTSLDDETKTSKELLMRCSPSWPKIFVSFSIFTLQYWLSGVLYASQIVDRTTILNVMSTIAAVGFYFFDGSLSGLITSAATAIGGPLIEVGLLSASLRGLLPGGGYHYTDLGETGFFPLWIAPVYFMGGPAVGNLARGFWNALSSSSYSFFDRDDSSKGGAQQKQTRCTVCNDTRRNACPNCEGIGIYTAMGGQSVTCSSCQGRGFVICRACFSRYNEDPFDIDAIRELMSRMPD